MAFSFIGNNNAVATGATEVDVGVPAGVAAGEIIVSVYAFEAVAAGSGPWIIPNIGQLSSNFIGPSTGWQQVCFQAPSAAGVGIEVWCSIFSSGTNQFAKFAASQNAVGVTAAWSGEYNPTGLIGGGAVRVATPAQVTGGQPPAPSVSANTGELIVACGGDLMTAAFGSPSGFTNRVDQARSGAGTVEATIADTTVSFTGATGPITFPNSSSTGSTAGATATLAIRPAPTTAGAGGLLDAGMPQDLDIGSGYTLRVTALDQATGALIPNVNVTSVVIGATSLVAGDDDALQTGQWFLVPGPNA